MASLLARDDLDVAEHRLNQRILGPLRGIAGLDHLPSRMTETRSLIRRTSSRSCEMKMIATPFSLRRPIRSYSRARSYGTERRGRLVHDEHAPVGQHRAHDLHHLLICDRERAGLHCGEIIQAHPARQLGIAAPHPPLVGEEETVWNLAEKGVGKNRHLRNDRQFLVDGGDAMPRCSRGSSNSSGDALTSISPLSGGLRRTTCGSTSTCRRRWRRRGRALRRSRSSKLTRAAPARPEST